MAYIPCSGGGGGGGAFPQKGHAIAFYGSFGDSIDDHDLSLNASFNVSQGGSGHAGGTPCITVIANVEDMGFTQMVVSGAGGAYSGVYFFDKDGTQIGGGRAGANGTNTFPSGTAYVTYCSDNYNNTSSKTANFSFS